MPKAAQGRKPGASAVETTHLVLPQDTNTHGTAFGGRIMEWMDVAAGICAGRHSEGPVVTVAVDDLHFAKPIRMGDVVIVRAAVNHTWRTSMEVGVRVEREQAYTGEREHCLSAYFTFVGVDAQGAPRAVSPLLPKTADELRRFDNAIQRRGLRLKRRELP
ncbi:MAG: acyl-CoA thioesterase [Myxococcota bacterium]